MRPITILALFITLVNLSGCSHFQFPGLHRVEVQQGNIIDEEMVSQLRDGMTKSQVRYIMGTPLLLDTFHQDRWDYFYSRQEGDELKARENVTIYFTDDKVSRIERTLDSTDQE